MKLRSVTQLTRLAMFLLLIAVVAALAFENAAWASPSPQSQPRRSTVPRRSTDLAITKSFRRTWWGAVVFTLVVTNNGPIAAQGVVVTDPISRRMEFAQVITSKGTCEGGPVVVCQLGDMAVGEVVVITINARILLDRFRGVIRNTATVDSRTRERRNGNNSATVILPSRFGFGIFPWFNWFRPGPDDIGVSDEIE
jgi:uncharacterized repeat protein (TIGR01451 family)